MRELVASSQLP